jgi:cell division protein FtsB
VSGEIHLNGVGEVLNAGYKHIVCNIPNDTQYVLRSGIYHNGTHVVRYSKSADNNVEPMEAYYALLDSWLHSLSNVSFPWKLIKLMRQRDDGIKDVVPRADFVLERAVTARSNLLSRSFKVLVPVQTAEFTLPGTNMTEKLTYVLKVESMPKLDGSLNDQGLVLNESQCLAVLNGYYSDQARFHSEMGTFHYDGHAGNILYRRTQGNNVDFFWSDFGRTSKTRGDTSVQLQNSLGSIHNAIYNSCTAYPKIMTVLENIVVFTGTYSINIVDYPERMEAVKNHIQGTILSIYNASEQRVLLGALSNDWSFALTDIYSKFEARNKENTGVKAETTDLRVNDAELAAEIVGLRADNAKLAADIAKLRADDAELRADKAKLFAKLEALESQCSAKFKALDSCIKPEDEVIVEF